MEKEFYRITCENIGIYEYYKKYLWENCNFAIEEWNKFKNSNESSWLNVPPVYSNNKVVYCSFFTSKGYEMFFKNTYPLLIKWIDKDKINIEKVRIKANLIVYEDEYQIVIENTNIH